MATLKKYRVQLLNENTGELEEDVDIMTSAECVTFTDGETFEQKLAAGKLTGPQGIQGIQGLKGDPGQTGKPGADGTDGADGATWLFGTAVPSTQGKTGDFYLKTDTFDIYSKATGSWVKSGNIKGAKGDTGLKGETGPQGPKGETGLQGPQGLKGETGAKGDKGDKGDPGDTVKVGTSIGTATQKKLFFKIVS